MRRRALIAALLTLAMVAALVPVAGAFIAPAAAAATAGQSGSSSGKPVYATGTGGSANKDKVAWVSWGSNGDAISTDPSAVRTVTNWHQVSDTERVEVTCTLTPKPVTVFTSTFDGGTYAPWTKYVANGQVGLGLITDPDPSRTGQSLRMTSVPTWYDTASIDLLQQGLTKGATYTISFKAGISGAGSTTAHFTVYDGTNYTPVSAAQTLSSGAWTTITGTYTVPAAAAQAKMYVDLSQTGTFPIDVVIDDVTIAGASTTTVQAYQPGGYTGDGLAKQYPGIGPVGVRQLSPDGASFSFSVACAGKLVEYDAGGKVVGTPRTVDIGGLVVADAESTRGGEYILATPQVAPGSSPWWQIDRFDGGCSTQHGYARAQTGGPSWQLRLDNPGQECTNGGTPNAVVLARGVTALDVTVKGGGMTAAGFGYVLATDYGDAPATFGASGALIRPTWSGTALASGTTGLAGYRGTGTCSSDGMGVETCASPYQQQVGNLASAASPALSLGPTAAANGSVPFSADAKGDTPDEDAFGAGIPAPTIDVRPGVAPFVLATATCRGGAASVAAWLDWNGNGTFDAGERSDVAACPTTSSPVTLTWSSVAAVNPPAGGTSFLRLRVSTDSSDLNSPTRAILNGEVEDWQVTVRAPLLSVTKQASVATVPAAEQTVTYTVTMRNVGSLDFTSTYPAYLADDVTAAADDATLGAVTAPTPATVAGNRVAWSGALPAGQSVTLTYPMVVKASPGDRVMTNVVQVAPTALGATITCPPSEASAGRCARVDLWAVGLTVEKRAYDASRGVLLPSGSVLAPATAVRWDYVVTNTGSAPMKNVTLTDDWAETRTSAGSTAPLSGRTVLTCPGLASGTSVVIPQLAAGGSITCTATRTVVPNP